MAKHGNLKPSKAKEILKHGEVKGHPLTKKAKRFMGLVASGKKPTKV